MLKIYTVSFLCILSVYGQNLPIDEETKQKIIQSGISLEQAKKYLNNI